MNSILDLLGKFHPLLLHVPIGVLIYAYIHFGYDFVRGKNKKPVNIKFALAFGALSAVLSAISGYFLSVNGDYVGDTLVWHKWLGIGTAVGAILLFFYYEKGDRGKGFLLSYTILMILLAATGHYGGSLTHGEDFLSFSQQLESETLEINDVNQADVFQHLILPIANRKCVSCHNATKVKGELLLTSVDGWKKGGKTGNFLIPGDVENSLLSIRAHLPMDDKKHMPPSGKLQLEAEEVALLNWWIDNMNHYTHKVKELFPPPHIMKYIESRLDYSTKGVPEIIEEDILSMQAQGIPVQRLSEDKPWISIEYGRGEQINDNDLDDILEYKKNIRSVKMSKAGLTDQQVKSLEELENLQSLDVSLNQVTSKAISRLSRLEHLENLNLYGTNVDSELLSSLSKFKSLKNLFLWQSNVNLEDLGKVSIPENLNINLGQDLSVFGEVQLMPPSIIGARDIFVDTIQVKLQHQGSNAQIHYTIDGTEPSENSMLYNEPILLEKTAMVRAIASMNGWKTSEDSEKSFLKSTYKISSCKIDPAPNEKYAADGTNTVIDLKKASAQFGDGKWLGFSATDISLTLDLGEVDEIKAISFGSLRDYRSYIFNPIGASISLSIDGKIFENIKEVTYEQITKPEENLVNNFIIEVPKSNARYIKLDIIAQKKNPDWHPNPGADCWLFIDEVVVE